MVNYKFEIYHHKQKIQRLHSLCNSAASLWNHVYKLDRMYYKLYKKSPSLGVMQKHIAKLVKKSQYWSLLGSQTVQEIVERFYNAKERFFKKLARFPKCKKWRNFRSFCFKQSTGYKIVGNHLHINKINTTFTFWKDRKIEGEIKNIRLKRTPSGKWFLVACTTKSFTNTLEKRCNASPEGFDFGLKNYLTTSSGKKYESPRFLKQSQRKLKKKQQSLARKKKGSNHREQSRIAVAKQYEKITNQRNDYQWKLAHELCKKHDVICLENLNMKGIQKLWGKKIEDLAHSGFVQKLKHVATKYGTVVVEVGRYYPSSKTCSGCGYIKTDLTLSDRDWVCPQCGCHHDRDVNAAKNILREGILSLRSGSKTLIDTMSVGQPC